MGQKGANYQYFMNIMWHPRGRYKVVKTPNFKGPVAYRCVLSVHQEKNHTVCRHSGGAIFLFICIKKQIIRFAVIQEVAFFYIY